MDMINRLKVVTCLASMSVFLTGCSSESWFGGDKKLDMPGVRESLVVRSKDIMITSNDAGPAIVPMATSHNYWIGYYNDMARLGANFEWDKNTVASKSLSFSSDTYLVRSSLPIIDESSITTLSVDGVISMYDKNTYDAKWSNDFFQKEEVRGILDFIMDKFLVGGMRKDGGVIYASAGLGKVIAINAETGENIWVAPLSSPVRSIPVVYENVVIFHSIDNKVYALDKNTGSPVWTYIANSEEVNPLAVTSPQIVNGKMFLRLNNDEVVCLDPVTGDEVWASSLANKGMRGYVSRATLNYDNAFFIYDSYIITTNSFGHIFKIDMFTGDIIFSKDVSSTGKMWLAGTDAYFISTSNELICLNMDSGAARWATPITKVDDDGKPVVGFYVSAPIMANGNIYVPNNMGEMLEIDIVDGKVLSTIKIDDDVYLPPLFADKKMYVLDNRGSLSVY